jgi:hypothetical protein
MRLNKDWNPATWCSEDRLSLGAAIGIILLILTIFPTLGALLGA